MKYVFLLSSKAGAGSFSELEHSIVKCYSSNNLKYTIIKQNTKTTLVKSFKNIVIVRTSFCMCVQEMEH